MTLLAELKQKLQYEAPKARPLTPALGNHGLTFKRGNEAAELARGCAGECSACAVREDCLQTVIKVGPYRRG